MYLRSELDLHTFIFCELCKKRMPQNIEFSPENNLSFLTHEAYNSIGPVIKCLAWENFELDSSHKT